MVKNVYEIPLSNHIEFEKYFGKYDLSNGNIQKTQMIFKSNGIFERYCYALNHGNILYIKKHYLVICKALSVMELIHIIFF